MTTLLKLLTKLSEDPSILEGDPLVGELLDTAF